MSRFAKKVNLFERVLVIAADSNKFFIFLHNLIGPN